MANTIPQYLIANATTAITIAKSTSPNSTTAPVADDKKPVKTLLKGLFIRGDGGYQTGNANLPYDENKDTYKETKESGRKEHHAPGQRGGLGEVAVGGRYSLFSDLPVYAGGQVGLRLDRLRDKDKGSKDKQGNELVEGLQGRMALPLDLRLDAGFRTDTWSIGAFFAYSPDALSVWSVNSGADNSDLDDLGIGETTQTDGVSAYRVTEALKPSNLRSFTYGLEGTMKLAQGLDANLNIFGRSNRFNALISTTNNEEAFRNNEFGATAGLTFTPGELVRKTSTPATGATQEPPTPPDPIRAFDLDPPPPLDRNNSGTIAEYTRVLPEVNNAAKATQLPDGYTVDIGEKRIPISKGATGLENPEDVAHLVVKDPGGNVVGVLYDKNSGIPLTPDAWISAAEKSKPQVEGIKKDFESFVADFQKIFGDKNPFITDHPTPQELADFKIHVANLKAAVTAYKDAKSKNDTTAMASAKTDIESARLATNADIDIMFLEIARADVKNLFPYVDSAGELIDPLEEASKVTKTKTFQQALGGGRLSVAGHTDASVPGRKTKAEGIKYNKELSERRATSATEILSIANIDAVPKGYGSTRLKDKAKPNDAKNRRDELEILNPDDTTQPIGVIAQGLSTQAATLGSDPVSYDTFAEIVRVGDADANSLITLTTIKLQTETDGSVSEFAGAKTKIEDEDLKYKNKYDATKKAYDKEKAKRDSEIDEFDRKHGTTSPKEPSDEIDLGATGGTSRLGG